MRRASGAAAGAAYVGVAVPAPALLPLTYHVPEALRAAAVPGVRVRVPLGTRTVEGVIVEIHDGAPEGVACRDVLAVLDEPDRPALPPDLLETVRWAADYYIAPLGDAVRSALPAAVKPPPAQVRLTPAGEDALRLPGGLAELRWLAARPGGRAARAAFAAQAGRASRVTALVRAGLVAVVQEDEARGAPATRRVLVPAASVAADPGAALAALGRAPARRAALEAVIAGPPRGTQELARELAISPDAIAALVKAGLVEARAEARPVAPVAETGLPIAPPPVLTAEQDAAVAHLVGGIERGTFEAAVLFGVTGSGKTEVYLRAAEQALARGRSVLVLVPEIGLTPLLAEALAARFGETVVVLHSGVTDRQRHDAWQRARSGAARVVVGARSALFAPLVGLGLIVVDEEHDGGYKQEELPRYHARDLALVRGRAANAVVVLGSATPSMEAWSLAAEGRAALLELPRRVGGGSLARALLVDMRDEFRETKQAVVFSRTLTQQLEATLDRGEQAMVLLNRRGWSRSILCRSCGEPLACKSCSIALTWHRVGERLRCHYCGWSRERPSVCPGCASEHLAEVGEGTQQAEDLLRTALPRARVERLDRDAVRSSARLADVLGRFGRGEIDVLVGTQMIAKGHHFPRVTLVGVLSADAALRLPDFRAAERTFQLLTQVAGRAGRGERPGTVVVQAFRPDHPALQTALDQDYAAFAARELAARQLLRYPPSAALANLVVRDRDAERGRTRALDLAARIREAGEGHVAVLGPTPAPIARLKDEWRVQLLLRARKRRRLQDALRRALGGLDEGGGAPRWLVVDIDPLNVL